MDLKFQFERLATELYSAGEANVRKEAQQHLEPLLDTNVRNIETYFEILSTVKTTYGQYCVIDMLQKCLSMHWSGLTDEARRDLHTKLLSSIGFEAPRFLATGQYKMLVRLFARVTKYGWTDLTDFRTAVTNIADSCLGSTVDEQRILGVRTLIEIVNEMSQRSPGRTISQNRRSTMMFRDKTLLTIAELAVNQLRRLYQAELDIPAEIKGQLQGHYLELASACFSFDFTCTTFTLDPSSDSFTVQIPATWRPLIQTEWLIDLFYSIFKQEAAPKSTRAMETLTQLAAVKNSMLPTDADKLTYLNKLIDGALVVASENLALRSEDDYHLFCQLIFRLKPPFFSYRNMQRCVNFNRYVDAIATFTSNSLREYSYCRNGVHFLMKTWSRLAKNSDQPMPDAVQTSIPTAAASISQQFISMYLDVIREAYSDDSYMTDDPLLDSQLDGMLESVTNLTRACYTQSADLLSADITRMTGLLGAGQNDVTEAETAWIVRVVAAILSGRITPGNEAHDAELAGRTFALLRMLDQRNVVPRPNTSAAFIHLEHAAIAFLAAFRHAFISDNEELANKIYPGLAQHANLNSARDVLSYMVSKLSFSLQTYGTVSRITGSALDLFDRLTANYYTAKLLPTLPVTVDMLDRHASDVSIFTTPETAKLRARLYHVLGVLLFNQKDATVIDRYVRPLLTSVNEAIKAVQMGAGTPSSDQAVVRACRDMSGLLKAVQKASDFTLLYDLIMPQNVNGPAPSPFFDMLNQVIVTSSRDSTVVIPIMRVIIDFIAVTQKSYDISFDNFNMAGYRIFGAASKIMHTIATAYLAVLPSVHDIAIDDSQLWPQCYKIIHLLVLTVNKAVQASFCNFAVFKLFGDSSVEDLLDTILQLVCTAPHDDLLSYTKLARSTTSFLQTVTSSHIIPVARLSPAHLASLLEFLTCGMMETTSAISTTATGALENVALFIVNNQRVTTSFRRDVADLLVAKLMEVPATLPGIMQSLFDVVMYHEVLTTWSLSKALLPLMVLLPSELSVIRARLASRASDQRGQMEIERCFDGLLTDVDGVEDVEKFSTNLQVFVHSMSGTLK